MAQWYEDMILRSRQRNRHNSYVVKQQQERLAALAAISTHLAVYSVLPTLENGMKGIELTAGRRPRVTWSAPEFDYDLDQWVIRNNAEARYISAVGDNPAPKVASIYYDPKFQQQVERRDPYVRQYIKQAGGWGRYLQNLAKNLGSQSSSAQVKAVAIGLCPGATSEPMWTGTLPTPKTVQKKRAVIFSARSLVISVE